MVRNQKANTKETKAKATIAKKTNSLASPRNQGETVRGLSHLISLDGESNQIHQFEEGFLPRDQYPASAFTEAVDALVGSFEPLYSTQIANINLGVA
jgi:hypothetical protein